jgi:transposase
LAEGLPRPHFLHKRSTDIANNHGTVVVEALQVRNMAASAKGAAEAPGRKVRQRAGLNRAILDQGWSLFSRLLGYKLADRGGRLIEVPAAYTSQTCSECVRRYRQSKPARSGTVRVRRLWPRSQCRHQRGDYHTAARRLRVEACGGAPR